jgi:hypothetical protein
MKTTISIEKETAARLRTFGIAGDTYDMILVQLMNFSEKNQEVKNDACDTA